MLKPSKKEYYELNYKQLLKILDKYDLEDSLLMDNDSYVVCDVTDEIEEFDAWKTDLLDELINSCADLNAFNLSDVLSIACYEKHIPPGDYIVTISW